ncbi:GspH/FimT family pseudopilin [Blastomonas sp.]|uniref:GspH/FimT family pseudopilin n=1 Tax=Blastomonas sp. TaxID=1909299 RepID=UPI00391DFEE3
MRILPLLGFEGGVIRLSPSPFRRFAPPSLSQWEREGARDAKRSGKGEGDCLGDQGFTLIELMVTLVIIGLVAGAVVLSLPGDSAALSEDADRFAARVAAARDEAIVGARPIAVWIAPSGYGFDARQDRQWVPLNARTLANRDWKPGTVATIEGEAAQNAAPPGTDPAAAAAPSRARFWFDSTGLPNAPVEVVLSRGANSDRIIISATGEVGRPQ